MSMRTRSGSSIRRPTGSSRRSLWGRRRATSRWGRARPGSRTPTATACPGSTRGRGWAVVDETIPVGSSPSGNTTGNGAVWVADSLDDTVTRIDPTTNTPRQVIPVGNGPVGIAYAAGSVWVANTGDGTITKIDSDSGKPSPPLPIAATELAYGAGTLWASESSASRVVRINPG